MDVIARMISVKKVGIMTLYYKTYNYGAQLQTFALQKAVENLGYECEQICYKWYNADIENFYANQSGNIGKFREFAFSIPHSRRVYEPETIHEAADEYDVFIAGSDQIWGVTQSMPHYVVPHMTLSFVPEDKVKFTYGASTGCGSLTTNQIPPIKYWASKLDAVSVREQSSVKYIAKLTGESVVSVLDPSFLVNKAGWENLAISPQDTDDYIFVYNLSGDAKLDNTAKVLSQKTGLKIKIISYSESDTAGPREFLGLIKNAKYIFTNSFHGVVFSIIFSKQFYAFPADKIQSEFSKSVRITDLLAKLGLEKRYTSTLYVADFTEEIDYSTVNILLRQEIGLSLAFLKNSLKTEKKPPVRVIPRKDCCGCGVCASVCANQCIKLKEDDIGQRYPEIDAEHCSQCGVCRERCPVLRTRKNSFNPRNGYAAIHRDINVRMKSSSGGVFSAFAEYIIEQGGVVYGAKYDEQWNVIHSSASSMEEVAAFRGSKYSQSNLMDTFREVKKLLECGSLVLFSGCGCQINALKAFLEEDYDNLITVAVLCVGNASPLYWRKYIEEHQKFFGNLISINERTKLLGAVAPPGVLPGTNTATVAADATIFPGYEDLYKNTRYNYFRENCFHCVFRDKRLSDVDIGDWYGVFHPRFDDGYGLSVILVNSEKGRNLLSICGSLLDIEEIPAEIVEKYSNWLEADCAHLFQRDYIHAITKDNSASMINYENKLCVSEYSQNALKRNFFAEIKRNSIYVKLLKYQTFGCLLDDEPFLIGKVVIYGAGKIGRLLAECTEDKVLCFVDGSDKIKSAAGLSVYQIDSDELKKTIEDEVTFVITPVWDYEDIYQNIKLHFPNANVVSIEKVVEKIWE